MCCTYCTVLIGADLQTWRNIAIFLPVARCICEVIEQRKVVRERCTVAAASYAASKEEVVLRKGLRRLARLCDAWGRARSAAQKHLKPSRELACLSRCDTTQSFF